MLVPSPAGKTPHASGQLSSCATINEPMPRNPPAATAEPLCSSCWSSRTSGPVLCNDRFGISHWSLDSQRLPGHLSRWFLRVSEGRLQKRSSEEQWAGRVPVQARPCPASHFPRGHCSPSLGHTPPPLLHSHVVWLLSVPFLWTALLQAARSRRRKICLVTFL